MSPLRESERDRLPRGNRFCAVDATGSSPRLTRSPRDRRSRVVEDRVEGGGGPAAAAGSVRPVLSAFFAALGSLVAFTAAHGQAGSELAYTQGIETLCQQYAAAVSGMPASAMFKLCMNERHCWPVSSPARYQCELPQPMSWHGGGY